MPDHNKPKEQRSKLTRSKDRDGMVGYGRPPVSSRFKPGQSGNPRGRPKRFKTPTDLDTLLVEELARLVPVADGGRRRSVPIGAIAMRRLVNAAAQGDLRALATLFRRVPIVPPPPADLDAVGEPLDYGAEVRAMLEQMARNAEAKRLSDTQPNTNEPREASTAQDKPDEG